MIKLLSLPFRCYIAYRSPRYSGDQEDKEWLARNQLMSTTGGKAYLMVLSDILDLARSPDYSAHPRQQPGELVGFTAPPFMLAKMRRFISVVRTPREVADGDLIAYGERQIGQWEEEKRGLVGSGGGGGGNRGPRAIPIPAPVANPMEVEVESGEEEKKQVQEILEEIKTETAAVEEAAAVAAAEGNGVAGGVGSREDEELGFLNGMNLNSLVREFEMEAEAAATGGEGRARHGGLAILSLADDDDDEEEEEKEEEGVKEEEVKEEENVVAGEGGNEEEVGDGGENGLKDTGKESEQGVDDSSGKADDVRVRQGS